MSAAHNAARRPRRISPERLPENLRLNLRIGADAPAGLVGPCWHWIGRLNRNGYGRAWHKGREPVAHRAVYEELVGPIAPGLVLDHRCRTRCCCNPAHLEAVTARTNTHRGEAVLFGARRPIGATA
ncbi:HNH endonuclease signature motif containing protein [Roseococcus pinisoli]|uniref:HNH endonuclease n=1 Tax=Roseococcus pinisoli TaxID=2835040 RepID=A0ABS5QAE6_9PROT|nr:HNH endonuclease signature motif containing protein [Roseococcus pinisoli]MBS7810504.1 HNH endonuclease [Roseococcus pinisoli]